jgi:hypothetical protein
MLEPHAGACWTLRSGDELLGAIEITDADFPWSYGRWTPTAAFERFADLFARDLQAESDPDGDDWIDAYYEIRGSTQLHYPDGSSVPEFWLHIDGDLAWFRHHYEKFAAEDGTAGS